MKGDELGFARWRRPLRLEGVGWVGEELVLGIGLVLPFGDDEPVKLESIVSSSNFLKGLVKLFFFPENFEK